MGYDIHHESSFGIEVADCHRGTQAVSIPAIKNSLPPIHPGEFLDEILQERCMTRAAFGRAVGVSPMRISRVIRGERPVTAELALRFGKAFGQTPQFWMNWQNAYDLRIAERKWKAHVRKIQRLWA